MSEGWREAAHKAGRWFRWVEDGAEAYIRKWHDAEKSNAVKRLATVATATPTVDTTVRKGCLSHLAIDHASLSRRSTVPAPNRGTSNIWALITFLQYVT